MTLTANDVAARIAKVFDAQRVAFLSDPGGFLAYYGDTFADVDDETASRAIDIIAEEWTYACRSCRSENAVESDATKCPTCGTGIDGR
jgi:acetylglutamate kinase